MDPNGLSSRSVTFGAISAGVNTASLAFIWNPAAFGYLKFAGILTSAATLTNATYEYFYSGEMSGKQYALTWGIEGSNVLGGFLGKYAEVLVIGIARGVGIANTTFDAVESFSGDSGDGGD